MESYRHDATAMQPKRGETGEIGDKPDKCRQMMLRRLQRASVEVSINGYERLRPIGSGGFSEVYEAWQPEFNRRVAVKVLNVSIGSNFDRTAFEVECMAVGSVSEHPNIVNVYGAGVTDQGAPFISMELYPETLLDRVKANGIVPLAEVLDAGVQLCSALHRSHSERILHRDIKPQNIFFSSYGVPALGDFGIASLQSGPQQHQQTGFSFHYAAPEVLDGANQTEESDIYSLGATLYTALAGHRPFARGKSDSEAALTNRIMTQPPPAIARQSIPAPIERSLLGLLAKHPNDRPRSALDTGELLRDLQRRAGEAPTPLRIVEIDFDNDLTTPRSTGDERSSGRPAAVRDRDDKDSETETVTVYRARDANKRTAEFAEPEPDRRGLFGIAALISVLILGLVGMLIARNAGGDADAIDANADNSSTTTAAAIVSTTLNDTSPPRPPTDLTLQDTEEGLLISWTESEGASRYTVNFIPRGIEAREAADTELLIPADDEAIDIIRCLNVTAASEQGRTSAPSEDACR